MTDASRTRAQAKPTKAQAKAPAKGKTSKAEIYALLCPDTGEVRYIGKANNSARRLASHLRDARRRKTPVYCWIRKLVAAGKQPGMQILEFANDWVEAEQRLIAVSRARGDRLLNLADGGNQPMCPPLVRSANGSRTSQRRKDDPFFYVRHALLRHIGLFVKSLGPHRAAQARLLQQRVSATSDEALFWGVFKSPALEWALPPAIRADARAYRGLV